MWITDLVCLRDKFSGRILNVSYTEDGLTWTVDKFGNNLYLSKDTEVVPYVRKTVTKESFGILTTYSNKIEALKAKARRKVITSQQYDKSLDILTSKYALIKKSLLEDETFFNNKAHRLINYIHHERNKATTSHVRGAGQRKEFQTQSNVQRRDPTKH